eukprot:GHVU01158346.1.p2 GENE.GHVU01158346.1~~GHVU01158346.1.p2  ORF type:complete len:176 (-),score=39.92 GHVU01158346.1:564-1091(-)
METCLLWTSVVRGRRARGDRESKGGGTPPPPPPPSPPPPPPDDDDDDARVGRGGVQGVRTRGGGGAHERECDDICEVPSMPPAVSSGDPSDVHRVAAIRQRYNEMVTAKIKQQRMRCMCQFPDVETYGWVYKLLKESPPSETEAQVDFLCRELSLPQVAIRDVIQLVSMEKQISL